MQTFKRKNTRNKSNEAMSKVNFKKNFYSNVFFKETIFFVGYKIVK